MCEKSKIPEQPENIFINPCPCPADKPHIMRQQIFEPAKRIVKRAVKIERKGVDRKITAGCIRSPVIGKFDFGVTSICFNVPTKRCYLDRSSADNSGYGAMGNTSGHNLDFCCLQQFNNTLRRRVSRKVNVSD
jgi:hypothetical protein